ncbi:hypothetical protein PHMEG_0008242, partial [Phytophthora megakarya]
MVRLVHSSSHWRSRCIYDTSSDENPPPNIPLSGRHDSCKPSLESDNVVTSSTNATPISSPPNVQDTANSSSRTELSSNSGAVRSTSTSSPAEATNPPGWSDTSAGGDNTRVGVQHQKRRHLRASKMAVESRSPSDAVQSVGDCLPCGASLWMVRLFLTVSSGLVQELFDACVLHRKLLPIRRSVWKRSTRVYLAKNRRTGSIGVVAAEDIDKGEVLGEYLGEIEHASASRAQRPRNLGYRLVLHQRPEKPDYPIRAAINAETMGGLMRFVNHSCRPVAKFMEVSNGRSTTVIVATTCPIKRGQEVTFDYGDDLWFVCRCGLDGCRHQARQDKEDPPPSASSPTSTPMVRNAGTTNYSAVDIDRLLDIILKVRPLDKDEWERLAVTFNANRPRGAPERDVDSLRRNTRKPTGVADMPPHIRKAKEAKRAIDEKANVIELDDEADVNQRAMDPDFSFDAELDRSFYEADDLDILHAPLNGGHSDGGSTVSLSSEATAVSLR